MSLRHLMTSWIPFFISTIVHRSANCSYDNDSHNKCQDRVFFFLTGGTKRTWRVQQEQAGAAVQWQSAELVLLFSFFSTMAVYLSLSNGGLFFPSSLFEAIPTTSISSNKQNKKWPSRQNKNKKLGERQKRRIRKKENGKQWEREPEQGI